MAVNNSSTDDKVGMKDSLTEISSLLEQWEQRHASSQDPVVQILTRLAEILEQETESFYKYDPDPFDDRHPARVFPDSKLGAALKTIFKNSTFMDAIVHTYMSSVQSFEVNTAATRLCLDLLPGLETSIVFQETDGMVPRLFEWAVTAKEPLQSYAIGLLGCAVDSRDTCSYHKDDNNKLVTLMLKKLHTLRSEYIIELNSKHNLQASTSSAGATKYSPNKPGPSCAFPMFRTGNQPVSTHQAVLNVDNLLPTKATRHRSADTHEVNSSQTNGDLLRRDKSSNQIKDSKLGTSKTETDCSEIAKGKTEIARIKTEISKNEAIIAKLETEMRKADPATIKTDIETPGTSKDVSADKQSETECEISQSNSSENLQTGEQTSPPCDDETNNTAGDNNPTGSPGKKQRRKNTDRKSTRKRERSLSDNRRFDPTGGVCLPVAKKQKVIPAGPAAPAVRDMNECSSNSWAELSTFMCGTYSLHPLTLAMKQRLILQYLTPLGEYQDLLALVFEYDAMDLVLFYIELKKTKDVRLTFEALRYLASLLCHKKFASEFVTHGVQKLVEVQRPSVAAAGVSICLYYLGYNEDAIERMCLLPHSVMYNVVRYCLWLLESSGMKSGRCHATMFFSITFSFRAILELFDKQDGLRKLFNCLSTLDITSLEDQETQRRNEDDFFHTRQTAKHTCAAMKRYLEAHLMLKVDSILRSFQRGQGNLPMAPSTPYKAAAFNNDKLLENMEIMLQHAPLRLNWEPANDFIKLSGVPLLVQLCYVASGWRNYNGRTETVKYALDILALLSVCPMIQAEMLKQVELPDQSIVPSMSVVLSLADEGDPELQKAALQVIINCVCGPVSRLGANIARFGSNSNRKLRTSIKNGEDILSKMWNCVRANNGMKTLLSLLMVRTPVTEADSIRAMACKALLGLSRCQNVKQIVSKLPLFNLGQLQVLMKEPILQDKIVEHMKFCKYAAELTERVTGKSATGYDTSIARINKAEIVAHTKITFPEKELQQLIVSYLQSQGLHDSALSLQQEAKLLAKSSSNMSTPSGSGRLIKQLGCSKSPAINHTQISLSSPGTPLEIRKYTSSSSTQRSNPPTPPKLTPSRSKCTLQKSTKSSTLPPSETSSPLCRKNPPHHTPSPPPTLDDIVSQYLRQQHALCKNPVATCPQFSLREPHRCPEPKFRNHAPTNISSRHYRRQVFPKYGGVGGSYIDRKYIYSRFRPVLTYKDDDSCFTCCAFSATENYLILGTISGELKLYNIFTAVEEETYICHNSAISYCEQSKDGALMLTSCIWGNPLSSLWSLGEFFDIKYHFRNDHYVEFSKCIQDKIIGTKEGQSYIYDVSTGQKIQVLYDQDLANNYVRNMATFNYSDELVLNDGVLWDIRQPKPIHKFDKFNQNISGVFHPNSLEIVINSEIWDIRTFNLVHTVPSLDQCQIVFNSTGDVMFGAYLENEQDDDLSEERMKSPFGSSFRTFDAINYSPIATIDVKRNIFGLRTNKNDCLLAVVENQGDLDNLSMDSCCKLYEVGRCRRVEIDDDEDEQDDEHDVNDDDDDEEEEDDELDLAEDTEDDANHPDDDPENDVDNDDDDGNGGDGSDRDDDSSDDLSQTDDDDDDDDDDVGQSMPSVDTMVAMSFSDTNDSSDNEESTANSNFAPSNYLDDW